jgi:hypothetical protein
MMAKSADKTILDRFCRIHKQNCWQNLETLDSQELRRQTEVFQSPKMNRAAENIAIIIQTENQDYETL